jgi:hypothetical protein
MTEHIPSESAAYTLRLIAAELITEATTRGDLCHDTVAWAAGRMMQRASDADARRQAVAR